MKPTGQRYQLRLNGLTVLIVSALLFLNGFLAMSLLGPELSVIVLAATIFLGLARPKGSPEVLGTYPIEPYEAPGLHALVDTLGRRAGLARSPEVRFVPGGQVNAAAMLSGRTPVLIVTEALLHRLDARRLGAVLAHEVAHLANKDLELFRFALTLQASSMILAALSLGVSVFLVLMNFAIPLVSLLVAALSPLMTRFFVSALSRTREFAADLGSSRLTGDPLALADALEWIEYRPRTWWDWVWGRRYPVPQQTTNNAFRTHPPTEERIGRLLRLARLSDA